MSARRHTPAAWAPLATAVELVLAPARAPAPAPDAGVDPVPEEATSRGMVRSNAPDRRGWWEATEPIPFGCPYRFRVDGVLAPDPRSDWQPDGVHGPSVAVDHAAFAWTDDGWQACPLREAVLYELHVGTFSPAGTYGGVLERLDHLVELGITHVELLPLATFEGHHGWGYDGVDLYAPHPAYGTPDELKELVDGCHRRGIAVLVDVVYNHLGPVGNHLATFGPYFTDRYETPWGDAMNLDGAHSDGVRRFIIDSALHWLRDYHVDGLRLDAVHALLDTGATHLLEELADEVADLSRSSGRPLVLIAENDTNDPRLVRPSTVGGYGLDAHWCDDVHHAIHTALTGEDASYYADFATQGLDVLARALRQGYVYDGRWSPARSRVVGRSPAGLRGDQLVACIQNHDQVGNRARGERLHQIASLDAQRVAAALLLTSPFLPLLFQGEEWAASAPFPYFADHADAELAAAVRDGRRAEFAAFGWAPEDVLDPESEDTFHLAVLRWSERAGGEHAEMLEWYRQLVALRRSTPDLVDARLDRQVVTADDRTRTLVVRRGAIVVVANLGSESATVDLLGHDVRDPVVLLASMPAPASGLHGTQLTVAPLAVVILRDDAVVRPAADATPGD